MSRSSKSESECLAAALVGFIAAWGIGGLIGMIPWDQPGGTSNWVWHMHRDDAWLIWALCVTLFAIFVAAISYALNRWN